MRQFQVQSEVVLMSSRTFKTSEWDWNTCFSPNQGFRITAFSHVSFVIHSDCIWSRAVSNGYLIIVQMSRNQYSVFANVIRHFSPFRVQSVPRSQVSCSLWATSVLCHSFLGSSVYVCYYSHYSCMQQVRIRKQATFNLFMTSVTLPRQAAWVFIMFQQSSGLCVYIARRPWILMSLCIPGGNEHFIRLRHWDHFCAK